ncbi:MAG: 3-oxoacyl-ACP reductase FabG [Crocinitomicaceae bacterium]|nr:3-oxoacyl-ACP reductase FabG [Crocinitomicaceae bacterium]
MNDNNTTKNVLVTGGSRGIGAAISLELGTKEFNVIVNYNHNKSHADNIVEKIIEQGGSAIAVKGNIADPEECKQMIQQITEHYGAVDILINNAGITRDKSFRKMTLLEWNEVISTNLTSAYNMSSLVLPIMIENKFGRIINISSVIGQSGGFGQTNYAAAKAGLIGFSKSLALETAKYGITVNSICPGFIGTEMVAAMPEEVLNKIIAKIPINKLGSPNDIAKGVRYLIDAEYITGQCLNINGGLYM